MVLLNALATATASDYTSIPQALINTGIGMGVTFLVLILISFIISQFKHLPKLLNRKKKQVPRPAQGQPPMNLNNKKEIKPEIVEDPVPTVEAEEEDFGELVAVIMAAIEASMISEGIEIPEDGLIIRSIRKRSR
ncbi:MAG: OadG family protein [Eubacterium sp.]|nr:OadG family protein [Eubacterium sp.]